MKRFPITAMAALAFVPAALGAQRGPGDAGALPARLPLVAFETIPFARNRLQKRGA